MVLADYLLISISYGLIASAAGYTYYAWFRDKVKCRITAHLVVLSILLIIPTLMNILWASEALTPAKADTNFLLGFFAVVISVVMLLFAYRWTANKNLLYLFAVFSITIIAAYISLSVFSTILALSAYIVTLIVFLDLFVDTSHHIKQGAVFGSLYALSAIVFLIASFLGVNVPLFAWAIPNLLLAAGIYMIYLDGKYCMLVHPPRTLLRMHHKKIMLHYVFARYILYTFAIAGLLFVSAVSVHELGHAVVSSAMDCEQTRIIFDLKSFPHTEIICDTPVANIWMITIAGLLATSGVAGALLMTGENFAMKIGKLMLVYGFLLSYADLLELGVSDNIATTISLFALLALIFSFIGLSRYYIDGQRVLIREGHRHKGHLSLPKRLQTFI